MVARPLPEPFELRPLVLAPGAEQAYDAPQWRDALVLVRRGEIELRWARGTARRFGKGAVLTLSGLAVVALRNPGAETAVLVAVSRRRAA